MVLGRAGPVGLFSTSSRAAYDGRSPEMGSPGLGVGGGYHFNKPCVLLSQRW